MSVKFEWDPKKASANHAKHGVSFEAAMTVFSDPLARIFKDDMKLCLSSFLIGDKADPLASLVQGTKAVVVANALDNACDSRQMRLKGEAEGLTLPAAIRD